MNYPRRQTGGNGQVCFCGRRSIDEKEIAIFKEGMSFMKRITANSRYIEVWLFVFLLAAYMLTMRGTVGGDAGYYFKDFLIVLKDGLQALIDQKSGITQYNPIGRTFYYFPMYLIYLPLKYMYSGPYIQHVESFVLSITNPTLASLSGVYLFKVCRVLHGKNRNALFTCLLYAFGSMMMYYSRTSSSDVANTAFFIMVLWYLMKFNETQRTVFLFYVSTIIALSYSVKSISIVIIPACLVYLYHTSTIKRKVTKGMLILSAGVTVMCATVFIIHYMEYGSLYEAIGGIRAVKGVERHFYISSISEYIRYAYIILFSPGGSIILYNIPLVLSFVTFRDFHRCYRPESLFIIVSATSFFLLNWLVVIGYYRTDGADWGLRNMMYVIPLLFVPSVLIWDRTWMKRKSIRYCILPVVVAMAILINLPVSFVSYPRLRNYYHTINETGLPPSLKMREMFFYPYEMWRVLVSNIMRNVTGESMRARIPGKNERGNAEITHYRDKECYNIIIDKVKKNRGYTLGELTNIKDDSSLRYNNCLGGVRHRILDSSDTWIAGVWQAYFDGVVHRTNGPKPMSANFIIWAIANVIYISLIVLCFGSGYIVWRKSCGERHRE